MDYKQKYEQALEYMCKVYPTLNVAGQKDAEHYFPELKESEDERIRKSIIKLLQRGGYMSPEDKDKAFAWLEKQGEKTNPYSGISFEYNGHTWGMCARDNGVDILLDKQLFKHLENQGEQKTDDKAEPKFKVGDWIINSEGMLRHIVDVDKTGYQTDNGWLAHDCYEREFHLWTIQDAKDGDVLTTKDAVFIFKHMDVSGLSLCKSHCDVIGNSGLGLGFDFPIQTVHPATEEQRNKLEKAITAAGYKWNAEKKELRKIEQKPNFCHHEVDLSNCSEEYRKAYYDGWNNCNQQHAQLEAEQNHAWSEEDEEMFDAIIADIQFTQKAHTHEVNQAVYEREIDWLKSLKEKYTWKPSDEQIETLLKLEEMHVLEHEKNQENAHLYMVVKSIREQLLKLKGK